MKEPLLVHPTLGVNARALVCRRCGADEGIALFGIKDWRATCRSCGAKVFGLGQAVARGGSPAEPCPKCRSKDGYVDGERILEGDLVPSGPCAECEAELAQWRAFVADGGVYWKCGAGHQGVIKPGELAAEVRERANVPAPAPCGVTFTKDDCPQCSPAAWSEPGTGSEGGDADEA